MKRYIILSCLAALFTLTAFAQSTMTDEQIMQFVVREHAAGTSNQQIVTQLMQRGVDIQQIRRVRNKYEREAKSKGLGNLSADTQPTDDRSRQRNGKTREDYTDQRQTLPQYRIQDLTQQTGPIVYDETNPDWILMQQEMNGFIPDSTALLEQLIAERDKNKKKVFGRDIFNNKELSFEPNMNIATPQNYRLGPGDAVFIDIYGASQKTVQST
ncbi:MAG: capsule biosynthesis protein, partial [Prevotella sp.]|nr:capsule biosynthesis protein [Prevotella sp.]